MHVKGTKSIKGMSLADIVGNNKDFDDLLID